jgi:hypothetical protein
LRHSRDELDRQTVAEVASQAEQSMAQAAIRQAPRAWRRAGFRQSAGEAEAVRRPKVTAVIVFTITCQSRTISIGAGDGADRHGGHRPFGYGFRERRRL